MPYKKCPVCNGSGSYENQKGETVECRACGGAGEIYEK